MGILNLRSFHLKSGYTIKNNIPNPRTVFSPGVSLPPDQHRLVNPACVKTVVSRDGGMLNRVLLAVRLTAVVNDVRLSFGVSLVGDDADVLVILKYDDVSRLPCGNVRRVGCKGNGMLFEKDPQVINSAKIYILIADGNFCIRFGSCRNILVHHFAKIVAGVSERAPDNVRAYADVVGREAAVLISAVVLRAVFGVLAGAEDEVGIIIRSVAVVIGFGCDRFDAEMLGGVGLLRDQVQAACGVKPCADQKSRDGYDSRFYASFRFTFHFVKLPFFSSAYRIRAATSSRFAGL